MCPVCREPMAVFELDGVEIDRCAACGGTWLDAGELEFIGRRTGVAAGRLERSLATARDLRRSRRRCPRCPRRLREFELGGDPVVHLDRCPWGHGVWCDRGEMMTVIRAHGGKPGAVIAAFFADLFRAEMEPMEKGE